MEEITSRFYVRNLPPNISDADVKEYFSSAGDISNISIKNNYGFFTAKGTSKVINKISKKYSDALWNGNKISVEKSEKESFLDRLARERAEANQGSLVNGNVEKKNDKSALKRTNVAISNGVEKKEENNEPPKRQKKKSPEKTPETKGGIPKFQGTALLNDSSTDQNHKDSQYLKNYDSLWAENDDDAGAYGETLSAILGSNKAKPPKKAKEKKLEKPKDEVKSSKAAGPLTKLEKKKRDDERRRESLANREKERDKRKSMVQSALSAVDAPKSKRIVFDSDDEGASSHEKKIDLFDGADEEMESFSFPEYEGEQGRKYLKLQTKFSNDDRFKIDEKFLDDDVDEKAESNKHSKKHVDMVRFDPSRDSGKESPVQKLPVFKKKDEQPIPIVSKEKFYEVSTTMKTALQDKGSGFSLLAAYGDAQPEGRLSRTVTEEKEVKIKPALKNNPLLEESSDEELEEEEEPVKLWAPVVSVPSGARDNFFFAPDDPLITEGFQFMNMKDSEEAKKAAENFDQTRRFLKKIFKDQLLRRAKKTDMFKKKIGGMKKKPNNKSANFKTKGGGGGRKRKGS